MGKFVGYDPTPDGHCVMAEAVIATKESSFEYTCSTPVGDMNPAGWPQDISPPFSLSPHVTTVLSCLTAQKAENVEAISVTDTNEASKLGGVSIPPPEMSPHATTLRRNVAKKKIKRMKRVVSLSSNQ